jgi:Tol biopolymer transport system component
VIENPSVSYDGRWLVFDSNVAGNSDIYRVPVTGGEPERLTSDPSEDFAGVLSPDGTEVAFHSWRTGSRDLWVQPLDGRPVQHVTTGPEHEWTAEWSRDGRALIYLHGAGMDRRSLWMVRRGTNDTWGKPVQRFASGNSPSWSPDGRSIAYASREIGGSLMVAPADSGASRMILDGTKPGVPPIERPRWSADGRSIFFKSHDSRGRASIWSVPAEGGTPRLRVHFDDLTLPSYRPQWALGRDHLFFPVEDRQSDVWVMEATSR